MREYLEKRLAQLRAEYTAREESFHNANEKTISEKNTINALTEMIDLKARIDEVAMAINALGMYEMLENPS